MVDGGNRHLDGHQPKRSASVSAVDSTPPSTPATLETVRDFTVCGPTGSDVHLC